jgi:hypothetical protein
MADNGVPVQWERLRHDAFCDRSAVILGAPMATTDEPTLTFIAANKPNGDIIITVNAAVTLADVHTAAAWQARAHVVRHKTCIRGKYPGLSSPWFACNPRTGECLKVLGKTSADAAWSANWQSAEEWVHELVRRQWTMVCMGRKDAPEAIAAFHRDGAGPTS